MIKYFQKIEYIDAMYNTSDISLDVNYLKTLSLKRHIAYGCISRNDDNDYIVEYVIKINHNTNDDEKIIEGLVLPSGAVIDNDSDYKNSYFNNKYDTLLIPETTILITWKDVVHVANLNRRDCSIMQTRGQLFAVYESCIVIRHPETIRVHPLPSQHHPKEPPQYYIIPKSFILTIEKYDPKLH